MKSIYYYSTNIGNIGIMEENNKILIITFNILSKEEDVCFKESEIIKNTYDEIIKFLNGKVIDFKEIKINNIFTNFERKVFNIVLNIEYGRTLTYTDVARKLGNVNLYRNVGKVLNSNKFPFLIPCHRVISKNGKIGSYVGSVEIKKKLLDIERNTMINISRNY